MPDLTTIVSLIDLFGKNSHPVETFLKLSPLEQAYLSGLVTGIITMALRMGRVVVKKLRDRLRKH